MAVNQSHVDRALKVLEKARELNAQAFDCIEEARRIFSGNDATGDILKRLEGAFSAEWERRYGNPYVFTYAKDRPHWKRLVKLTSEPDIICRIIAFMADEEPWLTRGRHPFGLFVSQFNRYVPAVAFTLEPKAVNCTHQPRCQNDAEHTRKALDEMRGGQ